MTSFTVRGTRNGSLVHVTWTDGALTGDPPTVDLLHTQAELVAVLHGDPHAANAYPELVALPEDPLTDSRAAYRLVVHVLDSVRETTGDREDA
ncbi:hypothetical protein [Pseudonocardia sp.]|jgi:hypothetical protein|uniref:hypothetical protein n=1 Tax=Pseudonocardia sp. TaxID=60912 RepID=UPI002613EF7C|nr:hypothetical protein [Pseudonocardia sp.]MCW2722458.1 hypothetical protein [Pseudonocardia sp.]MDT7612626.1 hypothetical protein [Pseudonocardiales bacterium]